MVHASSSDRVQNFPTSGVLLHAYSICGNTLYTDLIVQSYGHNVKCEMPLRIFMKTIIVRYRSRFLTHSLPDVTRAWRTKSCTGNAFQFSTRKIDEASFIFIGDASVQYLQRLRLIWCYNTFIFYYFNHTIFHWNELVLRSNSASLLLEVFDNYISKEHNSATSTSLKYAASVSILSNFTCAYRRSTLASQIVVEIFSIPSNLWWW